MSIYCLTHIALFIIVVGAMLRAENASADFCFGMSDPVRFVIGKLQLFGLLAICDCLLWPGLCNKAYIHTYCDRTEFLIIICHPIRPEMSKSNEYHINSGSATFVYLSGVLFFFLACLHFHSLSTMPCVCAIIICSTQIAK